MISNHNAGSSALCLNKETITINPRERKVSVPNRFVKIESSAFQGNKYLISCSIPESVQIIEPSAFENCFNLEEIRFSFHSRVGSIPARCFADCVQLKTFVIPASVGSINEDAFMNATGISSIEIPPGVVILDPDAFSGWEEHQTIHCHLPYHFSERCRARIDYQGQAPRQDDPLEIGKKATGNQRFFAVKCKCGHVGKRHYIPVEFAIMAENAQEASRQAREIPRVKHHHKDAILGVREITEEEYNSILKKNKEDSYLQAHNIQQQRENRDEIEKRMVLENPQVNPYSDKKTGQEKKVVYDRKVKIKKPKQYIKNTILGSIRK